MSRLKVCLVGGGSYNWGPGLLNDMMLKKDIPDIDFYLLDINLDAAKDIAAFGAFLNSKYGTNDRFFPTTNRKLAFSGAGQIIITITTGGLDSMGKDLVIPEKYGIFHTVGDTVGPGGWSRAIRNIPIFAEFGRDIAKYAPDAFVLNYTNPNTVCTKTLSTVAPKQKVVGLCHNLFGTYDTLKKIFNLDSEKDISVVSAGVNHFYWLIDFKIKGEPGYKLLKEKLGKKKIWQFMNELYGRETVSRAMSELYDVYGYVTDFHDRHLCEFFNKYITPTGKRLKEYRIVRTYIHERRKWVKDAKQYVIDVIKGKKVFDRGASRESCASILDTMATGKEFMDVVNVPNKGQVENLPEGAVLETLGIVDRQGFRPINVGRMPDELVPTVLPHAINQNMIVEAVLEGNVNKAFKALANDPVNAHLTLKQVKAMGTELLKAQRELLPKAFKI